MDNGSVMLLKYCRRVNFILQYRKKYPERHIQHTCKDEYGPQGRNYNYKRVCKILTWSMVYFNSAGNICIKINYELVTDKKKRSDHLQQTHCVTDEEIERQKNV